jgi:predicted aconitase
VLDRRAALLEQVRVEMREFDAHWMARLGELVAVMRAGRNAIPAIPKAIEAHNDFMKRLAASVDACGALQHEERLLAQHLAMLQEDLQQQRH